VPVATCSSEATAARGRRNCWMHARTPNDICWENLEEIGHTTSVQCVHS